MKTKLRFLFAGALAIVLYGSYKILEPELFKQPKTWTGNGVEPFDDSEVYDGGRIKKENIPIDEVSTYFIHALCK